MTALQQLESILNNRYETEDGDEYTPELMPGMSEEEIKTFARRCPGGTVPGEIAALLKFARGFEFPGLEEINFTALGQFGFENIFPHSIQLAGDGFGNFWILDIDHMGNWKQVYYVCHDPEVVVKHSENLAEFIRHVDEFGKMGAQSHLDIIHEKTVMEIWRHDHGFMEVGQARNSDHVILKNFADSLADNFLIVDLRNKPNGSGFAWGKFGADIDKAIRHETEPLWAAEKQVKRSLFSKLFGK